MNRIYRKILLGLGMDAEDGHVRITKGNNFRIYGGSEKTHELMQKQVLSFNKHLDGLKKTLDQISDEEFRKIAKAVGIKVPKKKK